MPQSFGLIMRESPLLKNQLVSGRSRRLFLAGFVTLFLTHGSMAEQSVRVKRIGFLARGVRGQSNTDVDAFAAELHRLGYVEGQNILIEFRFAEGHLEAFPALA